MYGETLINLLQHGKFPIALHFHFTQLSVLSYCMIFLDLSVYIVIQKEEAVASREKTTYFLLLSFKVSTEF